MRNDQSLKGKTALVTGSTSGIGLEIAKELLARGSSVMLNGLIGTNEAARTKFEADLAALESAYLGRVKFHECDVTKPGAVAAMAKDTAESFGGHGIDVLVNNAGIQRQASVEDLSTDNFDLVMKTNANSIFYTSKAALPYMKRHGQGLAQIVNISSVHGQVGSPERVAYCAAKHAAEGMTKVMAMEFAEYGIRVNSVDPAFVNTELALAPLVGMANDLMEQSGGALNYDEAYQQVTQKRLKHQGGEWLDVAVVANTVADLADFTDNRETAEAVDLGLGYIQAAQEAPAKGAYFDAKRPLAVTALNEAVQALGEGRGV